MVVTVVDIPVVAQRQFPIVQFCRPPRFSSCSPLIRCSTSLLCRSSKFSSADGEETVELPTLSFACPSLCNDRCLLFRRQKTVKVQQLQYI